MPHGQHHHDHNEIAELQNVNLAFYIGIALNLLFVIIEVIAGLFVHSLSLLSDAGHNLADVAGLALSLLAFRLARVKSNENYTYGYRKITILIALFNAVVLLTSIGIIGYKAVQHLFNPEPLPGSTIAWVAGIGIVINSVTAFMFLKNKEKDINIKGAYLHLLSDALVSLALVIGGIIIFYTKLFWIDAALSLTVAIAIVKSTLGLLKSSIRLALDGVPENVDINKIEKVISKMDGVENIHHIHVWALSTTMNALTAHILLRKNFMMTEVDKLKVAIKHALEHLNIQHATLEFEQNMIDCENEKL
ncbi:MAG TPA: cation diffusion facilitator family transporter [Chitinophagaceae bacterium]|nr:cation diffusion facilitator family transporter [Chitinophagaceae bacterium]